MSLCQTTTVLLVPSFAWDTPHYTDNTNGLWTTSRFCLQTFGGRAVGGVSLNDMKLPGEALLTRIRAFTGLMDVKKILVHVLAPSKRKLTKHQETQHSNTSSRKKSFTPTIMFAARLNSQRLMLKREVAASNVSIEDSWIDRSNRCQVG